MSVVFTALAWWKADAELHYQTSGRTAPSGLRSVATLVNPSLIAACLFRISANSNGLLHVLSRWFTLVLFSSDISAGVVFEGAVEFPHPTGIVIGRNVRIGSGARIFQNVTLGSSRKGEYPTLQKNVTVFSGAVIAGKLIVGDGAVIGANVVVTRSVPNSDVIRSS